ncbi:MAG: PhoH family protein [Planctomycetota bacterium]
MEGHIPVASLEEIRAVFGNRDMHARAIRRRFGVQLVSRDGQIKIFGDPDGVRRAQEVVEGVIERVRRGDAVTSEMVERFLHGKESARGTDEEEDELQRALPRSVVPKSPGQQRYVESITTHDITIAVGPAGSGKTFLAAAVAVSELKRGRFRKLVLARPAVEAGEKLGFLPGDYQAKVNPYLRPLYDALYSLLDVQQFRRYLENDVVEIVPLAYMRGRTLDRAFIILDEAQNTTAKQMKMFLTRMGEHSKVVINGDITQIDLPSHQHSGLVDAVHVLHGVSGIAFVTLTKQDIVRHHLVQDIVNAYDRVENREREEEQRPPRRHRGDRDGDEPSRS